MRDNTIAVCWALACLLGADIACAAQALTGSFVSTMERGGDRVSYRVVLPQSPSLLRGNRSAEGCWSAAGCLIGKAIEQGRVIVAAPAAVAPDVKAAHGSGGGSPSAETVQQWWKNYSGEEMKVEGDLIGTRLKNRELAYLAPVSFFGRGRNDIWHMVLIRPALREVREMAFPMRSATVLDLDHDGVSEVVARQVLSGQGANIVIDSVVQLDGWMPKVLHQVKSGDNLGACMTPPDQAPCKNMNVDWRFRDTKGQRSVALTETITTVTGTAPGEMLHQKKGAGTPPISAHETVHTTVNRYFFAGDRFVRITRSGER